MSEKTKEIVVVAAIICRDGKTLLARRREGTLAGYWEFPGGKIEAGETPEEALRREIFEELSVDSKVGEWFGESDHVGPRGHVHLVFYRCELLSEPQAGVAHDALSWVGEEEWVNYRVAPADIPIVRKLQRVRGK